MTPEQYERIESTFSDACAIAPEQRGAFLDEHCADDALVRAEVEAMLAADDGGAEHFTSVELPRPGDVTRLDDADAEFRAQSIPERIGRYRILRECGHGGMGVVYEAEQESPKRRVALKVIRTGALSRELLRRFRYEAEVLGRLQHPGIAQIFEAGSFDVGEGGQPFFAMEFIDGEELLAYAATHALGTKERLALFTLVCDAVHYAHQKGVIHRDLKPDNILVVSPSTPATPVPRATGGGNTAQNLADGVGQPKVLDFGVARMTDSDVQTTMLTHAGALIGTLQYMSPEQASQGASEVDLRSDVYTLGVVLFELLAGRPLYDMRGRSIPESVTIVRQDEPTRIGSVDKTLKGDVETIVSKCLEKDPERRYSSAAELAEDLRRHLGDEPIAARPASTWYRARKFARRNQALVGGVLATVVALLIGLVVSMSFAFRANESAALASANAARAVENEAGALRQAYVARLTAASALSETHPHLAKEQLLAAPEALRGWEWGHLNRRLERFSLTYEADVAATGPIAFVADGSRLVSALVDGRIAVWDSESAKLLQLGMELAGSIICALDVPSAGPALVACGTDDGKVRVWDVDSDSWWDVSLEDSPVLDVAWDAAGTRLLFSTASGAVRLWRKGSPIRDHTFVSSPLADPPSKLGFAADGMSYSASTVSQKAGKSLLWDAGTGELLSSDRDLLPATRSQGLSHDSSRFASTRRNGLRSCTLVDARTNETQLVLWGHSSSVSELAWTPDDTRLVTSSADRTVRLWDTATGASLFTLAADRQSPLAVAPDGSGVAFRSEGTLRKWDFMLESSAVLRPDVSFVYHLAYAPDGMRLAASSIYSSHVALMDPLAARVVRTIEAIDCDGVGFSDDGAHLFLLKGLSVPAELPPVDDWRRGELTLWDYTIDVATGSVGRPPKPAVLNWRKPDRGGARYGPGWVMSADGRRRAKAGYHRFPSNAVVEDVATGETVLEVEGQFWGVALSPDGMLLAAAHGEPGHVEIWSLAEQRKVVELPPHGNNTYCVDFHPDGTRLATGGNDNVIRLWDTTTWESVIELRGHQSYVKTVVFSPDGSQLASGSGDLTVRIWDTVPKAERQRQVMAARGR